MALPHLIKYVYNNGSDEVIRRSKKIHAMGFVELVEHDQLMGGVVFRVKDDSYATFYKVYIQRSWIYTRMNVANKLPEKQIQ